MVNFREGQKVVCIDSNFPVIAGLDPLRVHPTKHEVLIILWITDYWGRMFLSFEKYNDAENNRWFIASHFRPIEYLPPPLHEDVAEEEAVIEILQPA